MLPKKNRLVKDQDFLSIKKNGKSFRGELLTVAYMRNTAGLPRIGIIVSSKISKKATERNRIKRMIRRAAMEILAKIKEYDIVLLANRKIVNSDYEAVKKEMSSLLKSIPEK